MQKATHQLIESDSLKTLCGRNRSGLNLCFGDKVLTCISCLEKAQPGYYFRYTWNEGDRKYTYTIKAKYGIMNLQYNSTVSEKKAPVIAKVDFIPSNGTFPAFIQELYVDPYFRKNGWATFLIQQLQALNGPPIQLKSEPYQAPEDKKNGLNQSDLTAFYKKMGFVELPGGRNQMIWYPKSMLENYQIVCVKKRKQALFESYVNGFTMISGSGTSHDEALGNLINEHRDFFKISVVDVWQ